MKKNFHALGKRALALLIVLTMCVSLLQVTAFAAPGDEPTAESVAQQQAEDQAKAEAEKKAAEEKAEAEKKAAEEQAKAEAEKKAVEEQAKAEAEKKAAEEQAKAEAEKKAAEEQAKTDAEKKDEAVNKTDGTCSECHWTGGNHAPNCSFSSSKDEGTKKCEHQYDNDGKCVLCGASKYEKPAPCNHEYVNGKCKYCSEADPNHKHVYDDNGMCVCGDKHTHSWIYDEYDRSERFTHKAYCSCGAMKEEPCTTERVTVYGQNVVRCTLCGYWEPVEDVLIWSEWTSNEDGTHSCTAVNAAGITQERTEECQLVAFEDGTVKCSVCGWVKYDDGTPGGVVDGDKCPGSSDGQHTYGTIGVSVDGEHHKLVCVNKGCSHANTAKCEWSILKVNGNLVAHYCTVCGNQKSIRDDGKQYCDDLGKGHDWAIKEEVISEDGKSVLTTLTCKNCGLVKITEVCNSPSHVTVHYKFEDGKTAADDQAQAVIKGTEYSITSPIVPGYEPSVRVISGTSDGKDLDYTVIYKKADTHTLTILYHYADGPHEGQEVAKAHIDQLKEGEEYDVQSPTAPNGYEIEAGKDYVKGKMGMLDTLETVKYSLINYTWTIYYVDEEGNNLVDPFVQPFTVENVKGLKAPAIPEVKGYKAKEVSVTNPDFYNLEDTEGKVVYEPATDAHTLTIHYHYGSNSIKAGQPVADDYTNNSLTEGYEYDVKSPDAPAGYAVEAGKDYVKGTMGANDTVETVKYDPITYTWTINYVDENGQPMEGIPTVTKTFNVENMNSLSAVESPTVEGYTVDQAVVSAPTALKDITVTVHYSRNAAETFALTIVHNYMNRNGTLNHSVTQAGGTFENGAAYTTSALNETGYTLTTTPDNASGTINGQAVTVVYEYTANAPTGGGGGGTPPVNPNPPEEPNPPIDIPDPDVPTVEPDPDPDDPQEPGDDVIIDDPNVPLAPGPDIPDVDIDDPDVPMTNKPTVPAEKNPVPQPTATGLTEIEDEDVPLAEVPQTGDNTGLWIAAAILAACGLVTLGKKREDA